MQLENRIQQIVEAYFEGTDGFLANITKGRGDKIQVFVDMLGKNIQLDDCVKLSREIETILEEEALVPEKYTLEVSSPGMDNSFTVWQQYEKNLNKNIEVVAQDGKKYEGLLKSYTDESFTIEMHLSKKKKSPPVIENQTLLFTEVKSVKKKINF